MGWGTPYFGWGTPYLGWGTPYIGWGTRERMVHTSKDVLEACGPCSRLTLGDGSAADFKALDLFRSGASLGGGLCTDVDLSPDSDLFICLKSGSSRGGGCAICIFFSGRELELLPRSSDGVA